ncbi:hypothetical protein DI43_00210 [Geobacillus sp. CAMR12739]|nr:hypothetical protein DI43_00210 [Geobacillus sp. CAMR12739]
MTEIQFNQVGEYLIIRIKKLRFLSPIHRLICAVYGQWRKHDNVNFMPPYVNALHFDTFHFNQLSVKLNLPLHQESLPKLLSQLWKSGIDMPLEIPRKNELFSFLDSLDAFQING